jgi:hypothetical protein
MHMIVGFDAEPGLQAEAAITVAVVGPPAANQPLDIGFYQDPYHGNTAEKALVTVIQGTWIGGMLTAGWTLGAETGCSRKLDLSVGLS